MGEKLKNITEAFKNNVNGKTKNILFLVLGVVVLIPLLLWLLNGEENVDLSQSFEKTQEKEQEEYIPPKLDNPFKLNKESQEQETKEPLEADKQDSNLAQNNSKDSLASFAKDNQELEVESKLKELPNANANVSQEEAIRKIAKTQKPKDMIAFLKEIQNEIELETNSFKYDLKTYRAGDKFLDFFLIESITNNFIRFEDTDYAYNLRFLGE
ncbi:hypothetical protein NCR96_08970 [Helicobacter sp. 14348-15]|uniref:hypothetical protein n=1 Tax=Helicobacter colisuis TaxID=2949739 RepID=UPI00202B2356|nr:hypothetical protein [Helicobacter colisuis]MCL9821864.1 hypothetical protein [Helicobacter colisuis]